MSDPEKYPNDRALENVEDGFEDDLDVPTYRKLAEPESTPEDNSATPNDAAPVTDEAETQVFPGAASLEEEAPEPEPEPAPEPEARPKRRYDAYAAAGRVAPQVIEPGGPVDRPAKESASEPTQAFVAPKSEYVDDFDDFDEFDAADRTAPADDAARTELLSRPDYSDADYRDAYNDSDYDTGSSAAVAAGAAGVAGAAVASDADYDEDPDYVEEEEETRRGTIDFGLLILRLGLGALLVLQGLTTFLGWGGSGGTAAIAANFESNNFALSTVMATAIPTVQLLAGALLILGLATPLGAALALALSAYLSMYAVATAPAGASFVSSESAPVQMQILVTVIALALQFTGPGRIGVDFSRGWARRPLASSWIFCILAIAAAVGLWWITTKTLPFVG
nr:DoxX family membrane protein [Corynebacterium lactis]